MAILSCGTDKHYHDYLVKLECHRCGRKVEIEIKDRKCRREAGEFHELKRVGCRECKTEWVKMYFKCDPGEKDHEFYSCAEIKVINVDPMVLT